MNENVMTKENTKKFSELMVYLALRCEKDPGFGKTKLNKLLFFVDFEWFKQTGQSMTGAEYARMQFGPVPRGVEETVKQLEQDKRALWRVTAMGINDREQQRLIALGDADLTPFTAAEISFVDKIVSDLWAKGGRDVSDLSHEFIGWKLAAAGETIPYAVALVDEGPCALDERQRNRVEEIFKDLTRDHRSPNSPA